MSNDTAPAAPIEVHAEQASAPFDKGKHLENLRGQFVQLPMGIMIDLQSGSLGYRDVCLYCYLLAKQGNNSDLWWGIESLARMTDIPETGVKQSLNKLVRSRHIVRKRTKKTTRTKCVTRVNPRATGGGIFIKGEPLN